jgi:hypothetical protein
MDPISAIVAALVAGAAAAASETAGQAVKDAYSSLKALVRARFRGTPAAETVLEQHELDPEVWKAPLEKALVETGADQDRDILDAAAEVAKLTEGVVTTATAVGEGSIAVGGSTGDIASGHGRIVKPSFAGSVEGSTIATAGGDIDLAGTGTGGAVDPFRAVLEQIRARPADPDVDTAELLEELARIREEALRPNANPRKLERWLNTLHDIAPDVAHAVAAALLAPATQVTEHVRQVASAYMTPT